MDFVKAYEKFAESIKVDFSGGREQTIGASEIGQCARKVGYKKSKTEPDKEYVDGTGFATRGNCMENHALVPVVRNAIEALGGELIWATQNEQTRLVNEKAWVSATPDGLAINLPATALTKYDVPDIEGDCLYIELKSLDSRFNIANLPKNEHVDQVNLGIGLTRSTVFEIEVAGKKGKKPTIQEVEYKPSYGLIIYMDVSDYSVMHIFPVKFDRDGFKGQLQRAKNIMTAAGWKWDEKRDGSVWDEKAAKGVETLRPEGKVAGGKECKYCPFSKRCLGYAALVPKVTQVPDAKVVTRIRRLAHMIQELAKQADAIVTQKKNTEAELKEAMAEAGTKFLDGGEFKAHWTTSEGSERADTKKLKALVESLGKKWSDFTNQSKPSEALKLEWVGKLATA